MGFHRTNLGFFLGVSGVIFSKDLKQSAASFQVVDDLLFIATSF
jgi:hypothetical protein